MSQGKLHALALEVHDKIGKPVNVNVVRATLESMGLRAIDVQTDYQQADLNTIASTLFKLLTSHEFTSEHPDNLKVNEQFKSDVTAVSDYLKIKTRYFLYYYPLGLFHGIPVFLQIATIIIFGYSMWTYDGFNQMQSTAVVLGVIFGLIGTGGFVQLIGRQVSHYHYTQDFIMAKKSIQRSFRDGLVFMGTLAMLFLIINFFANFFPYKLILLVLMYSFSIGILLLFAAVFHPLKQRWVINLAFVVGAGVSLWLHLYTNMHAYYSHWIGIWLTIIIMYVHLHYFFTKNIKATISYRRATPKKAVMMYRNYKFFFYGLLFFIFIFIDRLLAWSANLDGDLPFILFYEKNYEIGMDIAIIIFFLLVGVLEFSISSFSTFSDIFQKTTRYDAFAAFNTTMKKLYWQHVTILLITGAVMIFIMYYIIWVELGYERAFNEVLNPISIKVSILGGIGYVFVTWGMLNSLYLFTLNKAAKPLQAIIIASVVNLIVGLFASRLISYEYSVIGMLAGSVTFMLITLWYTRQFFRRLDYFYYAAY